MKRRFAREISIVCGWCVIELILATSLLPASTGSSPPHDFELLRVGGGNATYMLLDTISHVVPQTATIWVMDVYEKPHKLGPWTYDYDISQDQWDCVNQTYRQKFLSLYRIGYELVLSHQYHDYEMFNFPVSPGTAGWDEYQRACGLDKAPPFPVDRSKPTDAEAVETRNLLAHGFLRPDN